jgi:hypothetical protein
MWIVRLALNRPYTFVVLAVLILLLSPAMSYAGGVNTYLQVVTSQTTALTNERNDIDILRRRLEANVLLIKAMGGGWDVSNLPQS